MAQRLRVVLVEDHAHIRLAVRSFLAVLGFEVVGEAKEGVAAVALVDQLRPDLIIMDMSMPGLSGADTTRLIRRNHPDVPVVMLSAHNDLDWVVDALDAGGAAYVLKDSAHEDLPIAISLALEGGYFVSRQVHGGVQVLRDYLSARRAAEEASARLLVG